MLFKGPTMADQSLLDAVQSQQDEPSNADVLGALHNAQWANTFNNTPSPEVLRNRLNLADVMNRAVTAKQDLAARTDLKALEIKQRTAQMDEFQRQAPMREQLLQAHIDATGATERRKAAEAVVTANDTAGFNEDISSAYQQGLVRGTPDFEHAVFSSLAKHPHANAQHIQQVIRGTTDTAPDYENMGTEAKQSHDALTAQNVPESDIVYRLSKGHIVAEQRTTPLIAPEQRAADAAAKERVVGAARTENAVNRAAAIAASSTAQQADLVKRLSHLESLRASPGAAMDKNVRDYVDAELKDVRSRIAPQGNGIPGVVVPPAPSAAAPPTTPAITTKDEFEALPKGAEFIWNGKRGKKP